MKKESVKNIALVVAGIDEEYQGAVINGVISCAREHNANIACFSAFGGVITNSGFDIGEYNIYNLINYSRFDGIILLTNTISDPAEKEKIIRCAKESGLPVSVLDCDDYPEFYNISIDNTKAMEEIVRHVINVHGAKEIAMIAGPNSNPEAMDRYNAFIKIMSENGLTPDARRIFFGDFRSSSGVRGVRQFLNNGLPMPEAIICANDAMALGAAAELEALGYRIPEDVILTGFDNISDATHHYPAITTVSRPLEEAGYHACMAVLYPEKTEHIAVLNAEPVFTESCGCHCELHESIREYKHNVYRLISNCRSDISLLNNMTTKMADADSAEEDLSIISQFIEQLRCEKCCICLCSGWECAFRGHYTSQITEDYQIHGYTKTMSAPMIWNKGEVTSSASFSSSDMYPISLSGGGNISFFLPLHFRERCLGYYIITNSDFPIKSMLCHTLMLNISNSIENVRKLTHLNSVIKELDRLYVMDPLCGIYNRNGFIRTADLMFKRCIETDQNLLISFIDMDGLKMINDSYGHKEGDYALQCLANVISKCCTKGSICARFGGDEFIILGPGASEEDIETLETSFRNNIDTVNNALRKPYKLSASIGTIITKPDPDVKLFNLITRADEVMYEQKKKKKTSRYLRKE